MFISEEHAEEMIKAHTEYTKAVLDGLFDFDVDLLGQDIRYISEEPHMNNLRASESFIQMVHMLINQQYIRGISIESAQTNVKHELAKINEG